jgi:ABC-type sulfate/molybdate transport systems ATPase subunit
LDEPTNYLDRDGQGALQRGLKDFGGGVIIITHNKDFAASVTSEQWIMDNGSLKRAGELAEEKFARDSNTNQNTDLDSLVDAFGNEIKVEHITNCQKKEWKKNVKELEKQFKLQAKREAEGKMSSMTEDTKMELQDKLADLKEKLNV